MNLEELRTELDRYEGELRGAGKARNTITTYVQPVERFLNWLDGRYHPNNAVSTQPPPPPPTDVGSPVGAAARSKYDTLRNHLLKQPDPVIHATFADIERILGRPLPASARRYPAWWANESAGTHVHARSWLAAGRRTTNVDLNAATLDFIKSFPRDEHVDGHQCDGVSREP